VVSHYSEADSQNRIFTLVSACTLSQKQFFLQYQIGNE